MSSAEQEARDLLMKATKKANYTGWFGGNKYEEAAELYGRAANQFKLAKLYTDTERDEAAPTFVAASKCYKKSNPEDAVAALKMAIEIYTERGRFHPAATHQKEAAMESYQIAADWYGGEEATAQANNCLLKVAEFAAQLEQYERAIEKFEQVARANVDNQLTKWSLKEYFLKAGLCHLCLKDTDELQRALACYQDMDLTFSNTREYKFLQNIAEAIDAEDVEQFTKPLSNTIS
ncbi:soluble NSF attachment protein [Syncephalis plumigaleata]|nr:soluble NSF attachment protein [Syncephalis plumigaleata]